MNVTDKSGRRATLLRCTLGNRQQQPRGRNAATHPEAAFNIAVSEERCSAARSTTAGREEQEQWRRGRSCRPLLHSQIK